MKQFLLSIVFLTTLFANSVAADVELVMVERQGCHYCIEWKEQLGPIYPNTEAGKFSPLRLVDIADPHPDDLTFKGAIVYTPTFILIDEGQEIARIEGYPGEDFFWALLERMLTEKTSFQLGG